MWIYGTARAAERGPGGGAVEKGGVRCKPKRRGGWGMSGMQADCPEGSWEESITAQTLAKF